MFIKHYFINISSSICVYHRHIEVNLLKKVGQELMSSMSPDLAVGDAQSEGSAVKT